MHGSGSEGVGFGWRQRLQQLRKRLLSLARESTLGTAAGEGVGVGDSVSEGVGVGDGRGGSVTCVFGGRGSAVMCVVGVRKGVGGVWVAAARALVVYV